MSDATDNRIYKQHVTNVSRDTILSPRINNAADTIEITVRIKNVYGKELVYPVCETARALAMLAGHTTFTGDDMRIIKLLGYEFKVETPSLTAGG